MPQALTSDPVARESRAIPKSIRRTRTRRKRRQVRDESYE